MLPVMAADSMEQIDEAATVPGTDFAAPLRREIMTSSVKEPGGK